jgi:hypothetical protein
MNQRVLFASFVLAAWIIPAHARTFVETRRASIRGGGGDGGKCTIEVVVDDAAEVEISGDTGRLRTLSGSQATWRRFECSSPLPRNPVDFRFVGIDGRGRVSLVGDPRGGRGVAVVRIEDQKGGREGYTFDLEWRGNSGGYGDSGDSGRGGGYRPPVGGGNRFTVEQAIGVCREAVADRARRDYGYRDVNFLQIGADDNPGRRDWVAGTFEARRGGRGDQFRFACSVDFSSGRVRSVEVSRR